MKPFISFENVSFKYAPEQPKPVLDRINLTIDEGSFVTVLGHNGSGKSTLAKHLNAILTPTEGKVYVDGIDTADEEKLFELRQRVLSEEHSRSQKLFLHTSAYTLHENSVLCVNKRLPGQKHSVNHSCCSASAFCAEDSISLMRLSWLTSEAPGS